VTEHVLDFGWIAPTFKMGKSSMLSFPYKNEIRMKLSRSSFVARDSPSYRNSTYPRLVKKWMANG
jgi:hypothetical protein